MKSNNTNLFLILFFALLISACGGATIPTTVQPSPTFPGVNSVATQTPTSTIVASATTAAKPTQPADADLLLDAGAVSPSPTPRPTSDPTAVAEREIYIRNNFDAVYLIPKDPDKLEYILQPKYLVSLAAQKEWDVSVTSTSSWDEAQQILEAGTARALIVHHAAVDALDQEAVQSLFLDRCIAIATLGVRFNRGSWEQADELSPYQFFAYENRGGETTNSILYEGWTFLPALKSKFERRDPNDFCKTTESSQEIKLTFPEANQTIIDVPLTADASSCTRQPNSDDQRIDLFDGCLFWVDDWDDELGFVAAVEYPNEKQVFIFNMPPSVTQLKIPAEAMSQSDASFEQCQLRQTLSVSLFVKKQSGLEFVGSMRVDSECKINPEPAIVAEPSLSDGLIVGRSIIRNGQRERVPDDYHQSGYAVSRLNQGALYGHWRFLIGTDGDIFVQAGERKSRFWGSESLKAQHIWGIVGDWLIISTVDADRFNQQAIHTLTAVALDGSGVQVIAEDIRRSPAVAPDNSRIIFAEDEQAFSWSPDNGKVSLPYRRFFRSIFSPDGRFVAMNHSLTISIYDTETNKLVASNEFIPVPRGGLGWIRWNNQSDTIAFSTILPDKVPLHIIRLLSVNGLVRDIENADQPVFSPDGNHLAILQRSDPDETEIAIVDLITNERTLVSFDIGHGQIIDWIEPEQ